MRRRRKSIKELLGRRTADVRSVGYTELFVLLRDDVLGALKDHPAAEVFLPPLDKSSIDKSIFCRKFLSDTPARGSRTRDDSETM